MKTTASDDKEMKREMNTAPGSGEAAADMPLDELMKRLATSGGGLSDEEAARRLAKYGPNALEEKKVSPVLKFLSYFWGPIPWMIEVAAVLSAIVRHFADLIIILVLLFFNAAVGFWQEYQAAGAVEALKKQLALKARVKRGGQWTRVDAAVLVPGDIVRLRLGDIIPADAKLMEGDYLSVDQSALTGESLPVDKKTEDIAYSGSVARQGEMSAVVIATGSNTFFGKTARLVSSAKSVSHFQKAVLTIGDYLIYLSLGLTALLVLAMLFRGATFLKLVQFALILIVASIPVAMPAVLTVTMAIGAAALAKMKAIVTRLESIEEMAGIDILCADKTGTLTRNLLTLGEPALFGAKDARELILTGALASKKDNYDAIDLAVIAGLAPADAAAGYTQQKFVPFDPVHKRTEAEIRESGGKTFNVTKGAPQVVLDLCHPGEELAGAVNKKVEEFARQGYRTLGVARTGAAGRWEFMGLLPLFDPPREDSAETIKRAKEHGIKIKMVTGDNLAIAKETASRLSLGSDIHAAEEFLETTGAKGLSASIAAEGIEAADGFAQVFPEHKFEIVRALQARGHIVGMTGDGVNDAPALKQADTGIAVSGATDAARAAAALVLTAPGLSVIVRAVETAREIFERMNGYAIYRIIETIRIMFFVVLAMIVFNFYPITTVMIILLALLNDLPIMTIAYDNTWLDPNPVRWKMHRVLTVATVLGLVGVIETFGLLLIARLALEISNAQIQSLIYLKLAVAGHLTLLVARTKRPFLSKPHPAPVLLAAILGTQAVAAMIVGFGFLVARIPWSLVGFVWAYCLVWVFIEDALKLHVYRHLDLTGKRHRRFLEDIKTQLHPHAR
ncbi:MAG: plasma-membrane proton-efflux P-type ATPase [Nitrospiraceae bacterium]|nr:plasma-membrane proton-efflux P-type ATPase [Nitrospiraceae bacterium]